MDNLAMSFVTRIKEHMMVIYAYQLVNNPCKLRGREWDASDTFRPCDRHWKFGREPLNMKHKKRAKGAGSRNNVGLTLRGPHTLHMRTTSGSPVNLLAAPVFDPSLDAHDLQKTYIQIRYSYLTEPVSIHLIRVAFGP
jgi:hypothetical protein